MSLSHSAAMVGLRNVAANAAEDLETMGAIMVMIGNHVPGEQVLPEWLGWFGRQLEAASEQLRRATKEVG